MGELSFPYARDSASFALHMAMTKVINGRIGRRDRTRSGVKQRAAMPCGFAQVKLCADFLDERFLLLQFRFESINFLLLLLNRPVLF